MSLIDDTVAQASMQAQLDALREDIVNAELKKSQLAAQNDSLTDTIEKQQVELAAIREAIEQFKSWIRNL